MAKYRFVLVLACVGLGVAGAAPAKGVRSVLFIGNSFTYGAHSPVWRYRAATVHDLNGNGVGGVPALFKLFSEEQGVDYNVSVETVGGQTLKYHFVHKRRVLDHPWDEVFIQEYSTLNPSKPGDSAAFKKYAQRLAELFAAKNSNVNIWLVATWSRPDLIYQKNSPWHGKPINAMAEDLQHAYRKAAKSSPLITGVVPVGGAFNRAIAAGAADPNPYNGIASGQIDLWAYDHYHASTYGYYLEALMDEGRITGRDPRRLGPQEQAAAELGISPGQAKALQRVAYRQLHD